MGGQAGQNPMDRSGPIGGMGGGMDSPMPSSPSPWTGSMGGAQGMITKGIPFTGGVAPMQGEATPWSGTMPVNRAEPTPSSPMPSSPMPAAPQAQAPAPAAPAAPVAAPAAPSPTVSSLRGPAPRNRISSWRR